MSTVSTESIFSFLRRLKLEAGRGLGNLTRRPGILFFMELDMLMLERFKKRQRRRQNCAETGPQWSE